MSMRTAVKQSSLVTFLLVLAVAWIALTAVNVAQTMSGYESLAGPYIGQSFVGGIVGLVALVVTAFLFWYAYGELGETEPGPETFPPEE